MSRVVVVGAGVGGLAAAARLARLRHDIVVVEATGVVGGTSRDAPVLPLPAAARDLFLKTGKALETVVELQPAPVAEQFVAADGTVLELPNAGVADAVDAIGAALGTAARNEASRFFAAAARRWDTARGPLLEDPVPAIALARGRWRQRRRYGDLGIIGTASAALRRGLRDPRLREWAEHRLRRGGLDPARAAPVALVLPYVDQTFRVWQVTDGTERLVAALAERATSRGARLRTDTTAVTVNDEGVVLDSGEKLLADVVVSDASNVTVDDAAGGFTVGASPWFGGEIPFRLLSAAAVAEAVGRA